MIPGMQEAQEEDGGQKLAMAKSVRHYLENN
jgi:hypothetical protein